MAWVGRHSSGWGGTLGVGLYILGIPKDSIIEYETQIKAGRFILIAHGSLDEVSKIRDAIGVIRHRGLKEYADAGGAGV